MTPKTLLLFGSLALLVSGCAGMDSSDQYYREMNPPYWEGTQLKAHKPVDANMPPGLEAFYINATLSNTARL